MDQGGIFQMETCAQFLQFMSQYFRSLMSTIYSLCEKKYSVGGGQFQAAYRTCIESIRHWDSPQRDGELDQLVQSRPYLVHMYEYLYYKSFLEFAKSQYYHNQRLYVPPSEIHIVQFSDFFGMVLLEFSKDSHIQQAEINPSVSFHGIIAGVLRTVLCECHHNVTCTDENLGTYLRPRDDFQPLTKARLRRHDKSILGTATDPEPVPVPYKDDSEPVPVPDDPEPEPQNLPPPVSPSNLGPRLFGGSSFAQEDEEEEEVI